MSLLTITMKRAILFLVVVLHWVDAYYVDVRLSSLLLSRSSHTCKSNEAFCSPNCRSIAKCINGVIRTIFTCKNNQFCNDDNGPPVCGESMGFKCFTKTPTIKFKCADLGFFSDVIECNKYNFCYPTTDNSGIVTSTTPAGVYDPSIGHVGVDMTCDANTVYSPSTATCEPNFRPCTTFPVKLCKFLGESFQVNGPIYAICQQYSNDDRILYPFQYRCKINRFPCPSP